MSSEYRRGRGPHFASIPWELQDHTDSTAYDIATYAALKRFADFGASTGARPSDETAASIAGCSVSQFQRCRKRLKEWGWIDWESGKETGKTNVYTVHSALEGQSTGPRGSVHQTDPGRSTRPTTKSPLTESPDREPPISPPGTDLVLTTEVTDPAIWMHEVWLSELGNGRALSLTASRRQKYRAMFTEQLEGLPDPRLAWRAVLRAVRLSDFHMKTRKFQMPESLLINEDRRSSWVESAVAKIDEAKQKSTAAADFATYYHARQRATEGGFQA